LDKKEIFKNSMYKFEPIKVCLVKWVGQVLEIPRQLEIK